MKFTLLIVAAALAAPSYLMDKRDGNGSPSQGRGHGRNATDNQVEQNDNGSHGRGHGNGNATNTTTTTTDDLQYAKPGSRKVAVTNNGAANTINNSTFADAAPAAAGYVAETAAPPVTATTTCTDSVAPVATSTGAYQVTGEPLPTATAAPSYGTSDAPVASTYAAQVAPIVETTTSCSTAASPTHDHEPVATSDVAPKSDSYPAVDATYNMAPVESVMPIYSAATTTRDVSSAFGLVLAYLLL